MEFELLPLRTLAANTFLSHLTHLYIILQLGTLYQSARQKRTLQPLLPALILCRLALSLSPFNEPGLVASLRPGSFCLQSAVATFTRSIVWSVRRSRLLCKAAGWSGVACMGSVFTIWLHKVCFSKVPQASIRRGAAIPVSHPCKYTMQSRLPAGTNAPGQAYDFCASALKKNIFLLGVC